MQTKCQPGQTSLIAAVLRLDGQTVQVFLATQTQHRLKPKHTPLHFQRKHTDMVIMCNKEPLKSAAEIRANLMMNVPALSAFPKHYKPLYVCAHLSLKSQSVVVSHTSSSQKFCYQVSLIIHIFFRLPLGSKLFILVPGRGPHVVDVLCRSYRQKETKGCGQWCPVLTESVFLCPHVLSIWPCSEYAPSLHQPRGNSRKPYCTWFWSKIRCVRHCGSFNHHVSIWVTLTQQVMFLGDGTGWRG